MKKGKCMHDSQSKGSAPSTKAHASHETGGNSGKHGMKRTSGQKNRKFTASSEMGV